MKETNLRNGNYTYLFHDRNLIRVSERIEGRWFTRWCTGGGVSNCNLYELFANHNKDFLMTIRNQMDGNVEE